MHASPEPDRVLTTILFAERGGARRSGGPATAPARPPGCPSAANSQRVRSHRRLLESTARRILATFDAPGAGDPLRRRRPRRRRRHGIQIRAGIHTGEVELLGDDIAGICVDMSEARRAARPAEILVSRTVKDLVLGSGISFADRGPTNSAAPRAMAVSSRSPACRANAVVGRHATPGRRARCRPDQDEKGSLFPME